MPAIDPNNPRQPFEQIADFYRDAIKSGRLKPGDQLPGMREIAATFDVAIGTANSAIKALKDAGLVMAWQGKGIYVRDAVSTVVETGGIDPSLAYEAIISRLDELQGEMRDLSDRVSELERGRQQSKR